MEENSNEKNSSETQSSTVDKEMEKLKATIRKEVLAEVNKEQKDPQLKEFMSVAKRVLNTINKSKSDPDKDLTKKKISALMPTTKDAAIKEVKALLDGKAIAAKEPKSSDCIAILTNVYAAYIQLSEKEAAAKATEAKATGSKKETVSQTAQ